MAYIEQAIIYATRIIFPCSAEYFFMQQEKFFRAAWDFISSYGKQDFQQQKTEFPGTGNLSSCCKKSREAWRRFDEVAQTLRIGGTRIIHHPLFTLYMYLQEE